VIVPDDIVRYAEEHTTPPEPLLQELYDQTYATLEIPEMIAGPLQGRFLELLVWSLRAERVLEIGTFTGYAALSMAAGLAPGGRVDTCERDEERAAFAQRYIDRSEYADRVTVHVGPALETVSTLEGDFDFVFIDADKGGYIDYYEAVLPRLSEHALIAADNTLSGGRVLDDDVASRTNAIVRFNERVRADERVSSVLLPIRDGVTLIRRRP
jgi:caffeoyl-CoA O-methyltransferase